MGSGVGAEPTGPAAAQHRDGADTVAVSSRTSASAADMWAKLADPYTYGDWVCGTRTITAADANWPAEGARLWCRFGLPLLAIPGCTTVRAYREERTLVLGAEVRPLAAVIAVVRLQPRPTGLVVELEQTVIGGLARFTPRLTRRIQAWRNRRSLAALIRLCETRSSGRSTSSP